MKSPDCYLILVCHQSLEERMVDHLLSHPEWVSGFSVNAIEGHSQHENLPSVLEQVRGRSQRIQISTAMNLDDARALISHLKTEEANPKIAYWITPLIEFGRLV